ncbi:mycofactocin-coupled SDR family oxidoreductase [Nonomuraea sp. NPDC005650]|uniref:mycofactocin-coupled SDR family oxidoreductase n=1 Tax=Nonomuraea sp. NPDC005650 TaxID=3157045 RepID=UPI0033AD4737
MSDEIPPPPVPAEPNARRYEGKVAFITGAARGQGRAYARRLAAEGADIIAIDIAENLATTAYPTATAEDLAETARIVEALGGRIVIAKADVRDFDAVKGAVEQGVDELGRLDVVIANAGMTNTANAWEITPESWKETIDVNLTGAFHTAKAAIPTLIEQKTGGAITFISSVAGLVGLPYHADYAAAKHGVTGLAKALANELAGYRIRVNSVHPHGVNTALKPGLRARLEQEPEIWTLFYKGTLPVRWNEVEDLAAAVAWISSDEARHVTGIQLPIDYGRTNR